MYKAISPGALGLKANHLQEAIDIAKKAGFEGVEIGIHEAARLVDEHGADAVKKMFSDAGVRPAGWGMPIEWRKDEATWRQGVDELPRQAKAAEAIGCTRTMTWVLPGSNDLPMADNRALQIQRFKPIAEILGEHGCRFGLEFIGPKTLRDSFKYPYIYRMEEMLELGADIGSNVGLLLDCWHWHTSGGTVDDLLKLRPEQVIYVHVNDAPPGVGMDHYIDNQRALPGATGVIDIKGFLTALQKIGYDGPVVPEPFGNPATWAKQSLDAIWKTAGI
jgi:sugar phosphate isomerase/epimerase